MAERRTQAERSEATRAALLAAGRELFAEQGYAAVGTEQIVRHSGLTRGALYHHFGGKRELFKAVFEQIEGDLVARIPADRIASGDPLEVLRAGVEVVLDESLNSEVQRIALVDAPAVLGYDEWREIEERYGLGLLSAGLQAAMDAGQIERRPVEPLAHLLLGALIVAAQYVARADDVKRARKEMGAALLAMLDGMQG
ncbi:TetR/AcrR family transcriptional regulator [soil metagenome]